MKLHHPLKSRAVDISAEVYRFMELKANEKALKCGFTYEIQFGNLIAVDVIASTINVPKGPQKGVPKTLIPERTRYPDVESSVAKQIREAWEGKQRKNEPMKQDCKQGCTEDTKTRQDFPRDKYKFTLPVIQIDSGLAKGNLIPSGIIVDLKVEIMGRLEGWYAECCPQKK